ncbi:hypothetical protein H6F77_19065 [Microcoleus sp. FACHB-831]|uniref:hypothetical protein n=1 Tax=Microcoleus sp. FACHB-831 TaxID=2692827 RepID=UPI001686FE2B|nr:hypothetical protein [Microcoleus sp. FACHB-831]MBD1923157.1 hypothetical protein [Microcoleus sp. FACHB-831]
MAQSFLTNEGKKYVYITACGKREFSQIIGEGRKPQKWAAATRTLTKGNWYQNPRQLHCL